MKRTISLLSVTIILIIGSGCANFKVPSWLHLRAKVDNPVQTQQDAIEAWFKTLPDILSPKKSDNELKPSDDIPINMIVFHGKRDPRNDKLTHDLAFEGKYGGQVRFVQTFTQDIATDHDVVGTVWLLLPRPDGLWDAWQVDYIRSGQSLRHWPWASTGEVYDYPAVKKGDAFGVMLSTLARDWRTNGEFRTVTLIVVPVQEQD